MVGQDGAAYIQVATTDSTQDYFPCGIGAVSHTSNLRLFRITATGSSTETTLWNFSTSGPGGTPTEVANPEFTLPLPSGEIATTLRISGTSGSSRETLLVSGGSASSLTAIGAMVPVLVDNHGTIFATDGGSTMNAVNAAGQALWSDSTEAMPIQSMGDGGVVTYDGLAMTVYDNLGNAASPIPLEIERPASLVALGRWTGVQYNEIEERYDLVTVVGPEAMRTEFEYATQGPPAQRHQISQYDTADIAAGATLRFYFDTSYKLDKEFGGSICKVDDRYIGTVPEQSPYADTVIVTLCDVGQTPVGPYHTHGKWGNDGMSSADMLCAKVGCTGAPRPPYGAGKPWWVSNSCGAVRRYTYLGTWNDGDDPLVAGPHREYVTVYGCHQ